jgi:hypothetical protein
MNYIKPEDIIEYVSKNPEGVAGMSKELSEMVNHFIELAVKECIEVFGKDLPDPTSPDYKLGSLEEVVNRVCNVSDHFSVKK